MLLNSGISLNWCIIDEVTTRNTTAYIFGPLYRLPTNVSNYQVAAA